MQKIISISLSILLFAALASEGLMILTFKVNQNQIIEKHCINKAKPEKQCEGKCFLSKIFKEKQSNENEGSDNSIVEEPSRVFLFPPTLSEALTKSTLCNIRSNFFFKTPKLQSFYQSVFHPPDSIS